MEPTMSSLATAAGAFGIVCAAAGLGLLLRRLLPAHHLGADAREVLKLVLGVVATMSALVLGLLVASAKASYDTQQAELFDVTAKMVELDRVLAHYGGPRASQVPPELPAREPSPQA
jgi:nitrate reductase gamma subunit